MKEGREIWHRSHWEGEEKEGLEGLGMVRMRIEMVS
jgi:hypothetical protein